ncbi:hypothetical protein THTE_2372 [Thermogutta terrifontis]|uniref:Uncharacterized protein n=1 Tax=Thermogutta terrifontis TaxID=1331910 RepID=A0A286RG93_9BACT|nr:hypothetical protein THTE_2372 [Thermogutta terrifontis]
MGLLVPLAKAAWRPRRPYGLLCNTTACLFWMTASDATKGNVFTSGATDD